MSAARRPGRATPRGQALLEFALAITVLGTLLAGILEFGRLWSAANVLNGAARDGARLAAITSKNDQRTNKVKMRVQTSAATYFDPKDLSVQTNTAKGPNGEPMVNVTATAQLDVLFGNWLLGRKVSLSRTVTMRDETATP